MVGWRVRSLSSAVQVPRERVLRERSPFSRSTSRWEKKKEEWRKEGGGEGGRTVKRQKERRKKSEGAWNTCAVE